MTVIENEMVPMLRIRLTAAKKWLIFFVSFVAGTKVCDVTVEEYENLTRPFGCFCVLQVGSIDQEDDIKADLVMVKKTAAIYMASSLG